MKDNRKSSPGEEYLGEHPELEQWMRECRLCHARGYAPDLPTEAASDSSSPANLRRFFQPLALDELGRCDACADALDGRR